MLQLFYNFILKKTLIIRSLKRSRLLPRLEKPNFISTSGRVIFFQNRLLVNAWKSTCTTFSSAVPQPLNFRSPARTEQYLTHQRHPEVD